MLGLHDRPCIQDEVASSLTVLRAVVVMKRMILLLLVMKVLLMTMMVMQSRMSKSRCS